MAFSSGFFNSKGLDRTYTAENFTDYLSSLICNGILDTYGEQFELTAPAKGLKVILGTGKAWINGHYFINDAKYSIDLSEYQDESLPRYVTIGIVCDVSEGVRDVRIEVVAGTPAENPSVPFIPVDANRAKLTLYSVRLNVGATSLSKFDWFDYREDENLCGYCRCIGFDGLSCLLPAELHAGAVKMSVFGYDADNTSGLRATTVPVTLNIRQSGFLGDDDSPIPPTPDLYTQILQKIAEISGNNGTVPDMSEYPKKDEIQKLIEQALENSETVIPSDYVTIEKLNDEILMIHESITPIRMDAHSHKNKDILDNTTASYTLEEQKKLAELNLSDYVTIRKLNDEILMVHEAITPIRLASHSHQNKELLDSFDADSLALLPDLQQFEDVTKYDIQTIKESLAPVVRQAHFHENLAVLDGITADRIKKWDSISTLQTQLNGLSTELTVWKNKCSSNSDRLHANEATIDNIISELDEIHEKINAVPNFDAVQETLKAMQAEIDSLGGNIQTIFQSGAGTLERHGDTIYTFYNNGYRSLDGFAQAYPNFCSAENDYALYYNQSDFSWAGTVYTMILKPFSISKNASIVITYQSGASSTGELYLMRKISGRTYAELAQVVYEQIQKENVIKLDFQWVQSSDFISILVDCTDVGVGDYYLAWKGVSDNTHPKIKTIKVLGG